MGSNLTMRALSQRGGFDPIAQQGKHFTRFPMRRVRQKASYGRTPFEDIIFCHFLNKYYNL